MAKTTHVKAHTRKGTPARVEFAVNFQEKTENWHRAKDKKESAMKPGRRKASKGMGRANQFGESKGGKYYEYRRNRTDLNKKTRL
jgi:hypothetical protein